MITVHPVVKTTASIATAVLVAATALFAGIPAASAAGQASPPTQEGDRLEFNYQRLLLVLDGQAARLEFAADATVRAQAWIDLLREDGQDVSGLESALADFNAGLAEAQGYHDQAASILDAHAGFDADGHVTDRDQAIETLRSAGQALRDAHHALSDATIDLRQAVRDWRFEHGSAAAADGQARWERALRSPI